MASGSISLHDPDQVLTEGDKQRLADEVHTPWDSRGESGGTAPRRRFYATTIAVLGLVAGLVFAITQYHGDSAPGALPDGLSEIEGTSLAYLPQEELSAKIEQAVGVLAESRDVDAVLEVVRRPHEVEPLIRAYYRDSPPSRRRVTEVNLAENSALFSSKYYVLLKAVVKFDDFTVRNAAVEWRGDGIFIDWEHWVHHQPIEVESFLAGEALPDGAAPGFRLGARKPPVFVPHEGFEESRYFAVQLRDPRVNGDEFTGYVERGTAVAEKLDQLLPGKAERAVMVDLRRVEAGEGDRVVEVVGWITEGWCKRRW